MRACVYWGGGGVGFQFTETQGRTDCPGSPPRSDNTEQTPTLITARVESVTEAPRENKA